MVAQRANTSGVPHQAPGDVSEGLRVQEDVVVLEAVADRGGRIPLPLAPVRLTLAALRQRLHETPLLNGGPELTVPVLRPRESGRPRGVEVTADDEPLTAEVGPEGIEGQAKSRDDPMVKDPGVDARDADRTEGRSVI